MLTWPDEVPPSGDDCPKWSQAGSNLFLDFHGDPSAAKLVVFSDGNHHMALLETIQVFREQHPEVEHVFYATTPPGPILRLLRQGRLQIGNFVLSVTPHVFISPPHVLDGLVADGHMPRHVPFMRNRGSVLLVKKGNPKLVLEIADLARDDVRLFLSNPETETVSYRGYVDTLRGLAARQGIQLPFLSEEPAAGVVYGERIHHREAPQALADDCADVAIVYYHLALRYVRIFPSLFEIVPLGGTVEEPRPAEENVISLTHAGLIGDGGAWGAEFLAFLASETVSEIYARHGLQRLRR